MVVIRKGMKRTRNSVISVPELNHSSSTYSGNLDFFKVCHFCLTTLCRILRQESFQQ
jgi:hypothetical protein